MPAYPQNNGSGVIARRVLFLALLLVALVLTTVYAREGTQGALHTIQGHVLEVTGRVGGISAPIATVTQTAGSTVADVTASDETLSSLREQNEKLRRMVAEAEEYRQEVNRLQALLNMKNSSGIQGPVAHIVGRSSNAWDQSITIDVGTDSGVESGMTVMGATGVIGQVTRAGAHTSRVRLLTDPNSGAAVQIQSTRANGVVRGSLSGLLYLEDIEDDQIPVVGDVVITSGMGGSYSSGLVVGTVVDVNKTASNATGTIVVNPNGRASVLEEVIVVMSTPTSPAKQPSADEEETVESGEAS